MAFVKTLWVNRAVPRIDAAQLNRIEKGIADAHGGLASPPVLVALPNNPVDGQEIILQAATERFWHLRYQSSTARWRYLGGPRLHAGPSGAISMNATAPATPGSGPSITVPFTGAYRLEFGAYFDIQEFNTGVLQAQAAIYSGGAIVNALARAIYTSRGGGGGGSFNGPVLDPIALVAQQVLDFRFYGSVAAHAYYGQDFWLSLLPVYLG